MVIKSRPFALIGGGGCMCTLCSPPGYGPDHFGTFNKYIEKPNLKSHVTFIYPIDKLCQFVCFLSHMILTWDVNPLAVVTQINDNFDILVDFSFASDGQIAMKNTMKAL